jgi:SOS-response transcriptional repressor LexA
MATRRSPGSDAQAAHRLRLLWEAFNLRRLERGQARMTQAEAARLMGDITQSAVGQYLRGEIPLLVPGVLKWSRLLGVPHTAIRDDLAELRAIPPNAAASDVRYVPLVYSAAEIVALLTATDQQPTRTWPLMSEPSRPYSPSVFWVRLDTDALAPLASRGDLLLIDPDAPVQPAELVAAVTADETFVVGLLWRHGDGTATLKPHNPAFPETTLPADVPLWRIAGAARFF